MRVCIDIVCFLYQCRFSLQQLVDEAIELFESDLDSANSEVSYSAPSIGVVESSCHVLL